ncbi:transcriptional regulator [Rhizobium sp. L245/93]|nr:transcriptional regulator [Rhizobium sp. L245/93]
MTIDRPLFQPPASNYADIVRRDILTQLQRSGSRRLTTIIAPAGYGKTSLAAQWYQLLKSEGERPVWLTLDAEDCDERRFLLALMDALAPLLPDEGRGLDASSMAVPSVLSVFITRLRQIEMPVTVFVDDYHFAQTDTTEALLARLLAAADLTHISFILISRSAPRFPLSALRLNGELRQIGVADLSFSDCEAQEFFAGRSTLLTSRQVGELNKRTEGWVVALQMVRVLVNDTADSAAILNSFDGSNAEMGRYLSEQVFSSLPEDIQRFLIETATLPVIGRTLVAAVCDLPDAVGLFNRLGTFALPIAVLDRHGAWIRYHPVFNGFLKEEAARIGIDPGRVLRKAARWFQASNDCDAAVRHAMLAGDIALAAEIIEAAGGWRRVYATTRGGALLFQALIEKAPCINLSAFPLTTLGLCVISAKAGQLDTANHYLTLAERSCGEGELSRDLRVVRVLLSLYTDRWASAGDLSALEADLSQASDMELIHRALALNMLSYNFLIRTELDRALHYGQLALRAFRDGGADFGAMHLYTHIGQASFFSGDIIGAAEAYRNLIVEAQTHIGQGSDLDAVGQVLESEILSMRGERQAASSALSWALPHLERHDTWFDLLAAGFMAQQRVHRLNGHIIAAHAAMDSARAVAARRGFDRLTRLIDGERVTLLIASGHVDEAARFAEVQGMSRQSAATDSFNMFAYHLRGAVPALLWTRIDAARGEIAAARAGFQRLMAQQPAKPHIPRRIELGFLDIRLLLAEDKPHEAAAKLSDMLLSLPVFDYRAILLVEGAEFAEQLVGLAASMDVPDVVSQRLADALKLEPEFDPPVEEVAVIAKVEPGGLTERERGVMQLLSEGLSNKEIGRQLSLSDNTVKFHLRNIFAKLNVTTRTAAVMAIRHR